MKELSTNVFTPARPARLTFVERKGINQKLVDALKTPGKQLLIYGYSGSGKTSLIKNKLLQTYENSITTSCIEGMKFEQLILQAFDKFDAFFTTERVKEKSKDGLIGLEANYNSIKAQISSSYTSKTSEIQERIVPLQLTPQKLAEFFGKLNSCWVIEDFHKMESTEKKKLSQLMKVFMDESVDYEDIKIIAVGAVGTAKEIVQYDREMQNRVAEIYVPLLSDDELSQIINKGESLLRIIITDEVKNSIIKFSSGIASVTHQLCLTICQNKELYETSDIQITFDLEDFKSSLENYLDANSQYLKDKFDKVTETPTPEGNSIIKEILRAFVALDKSHLTKTEIVDFMKKNSVPIQPELLGHRLEELTNERRERVLIYDPYSSTYSFSDPFFRVYCLCSFEMDKIKTNEQIKIFETEKKEFLSKKIEEQKNKKIVELILSGKIEVDF